MTMTFTEFIRSIWFMLFPPTSPVPKPVPSPSQVIDQDGGDVMDPPEIETYVSPEPVDEYPVIAKPRYCWCLDAGHGLYTPGKRSPVLGNGVQLMEWEFNRYIVDGIAEQLEMIGVDYMLTMPRHGKYGNALKKRVSNANNHASRIPKIFLSVHGNAGPARSINHFTADSVRGLETWFFSKSSTGKRLAEVFLHKLTMGLGGKSRGIRHKTSGEFYVLRATHMPAVLTENFFFNNRHDLELMLDYGVRQKIIDAHVNAILQIEREGLVPSFPTA